MAPVHLMSYAFSNNLEHQSTKGYVVGLYDKQEMRGQHACISRLNPCLQGWDPGRSHSKTAILRVVALLGPFFVVHMTNRHIGTSNTLGIRTDYIANGIEVLVERCYYQTMRLG